MNLQKMKRKSEKTERNSKRRITVSALLLVLSAGLMVLSVQAPDFAEWYSQNIYPVLVSAIGRLTGLLPFSLAEICLYLLLAALILSLICLCIGIARKGEAGRRLFAWFSCAVLAVSILAFLYTAGCGVNYHRKTFSSEEGIIASDYTAEELQEICIRLTEEVNSRAGKVSRDSDGVMILSAPEGDGAVEAMEKLAETYSSLQGYYPLPKKAAISELLSYQGLTGVYSPFTIEANYNGDMTPYNIPFTTCHELSHLRGFMEEKEANFIAFLACIGSDRTDFQYSGYLSGWTYCMNALYRADPEEWRDTRSLLDKKAEADVWANSQFWNSYEGVISETADRINDTYLRANGQADGVRSYDRMVDLIMAYFTDFIES